MPWINGEWVDDGASGGVDTGYTFPQAPSPYDLYDQHTQADPQTAATDPYGYGSGDEGVVAGAGVPDSRSWLDKALDWTGKNVSLSPGSPTKGMTTPFTAGSAAVGAAGAARNEEANLALSRDRNRASIYNTQQQAQLSAAQIDLLRRKYLAEVPQERLTAAAHGDQLANAQDAYATHPRANVVHFSGGIRPSNLSANTRALGGLVSGDMLKQQQSGDTFDPTSSLLVAPPSEMTMPTASTLEKVLGGMSLVPTVIGQGANSAGSILSLLDQLSKLGGGDDPSLANQMANS